MIQIIDKDFPKEKWNSVASHPLQTWEWGEVREKTGVEVVRIGEFKNEKLIHVFQLTVHPIPYSKYKIGYLPRSEFPSNKAIEFLLEWNKKNNLIFLKIEPSIEYSGIQNPESKILKHSSHQLFPDWTLILDLEPTETELLAKMKSKTRYNIRLAQKKEVKIVEMSNEEGFKIFSKLYFQTTSRQRYFGHDLNYHKTVWKGLKDKIAHILVAFYQDIPLAVYEVFIFKDKAYYPYGGSSIEYKNVMAPNLLMWETIRFAKRRGATSLDMWGASAPDTDPRDPYVGFTKFKEGYGGKYVQMIGSFDLVVRPSLYGIYNFLYKLRTRYLSLLPAPSSSK